MGNNSINEEFSFLEPYGNESSESKFERYWKSFRGPFSLHRQRVTRYSPYSGMTYSPVKYTMRRFSIEDMELPDNEWINGNLRNFVKTEFGHHSEMQLPNNWPPVINEILKLDDSFLDNFLDKSEWNNRINIDIPRDESPSVISNAIYDVLCNSKIGASINGKNNVRHEFVSKTMKIIEEKGRLLFVIPGFPFKDQNRFRVPYDANIPDMGEISFLIRLHNLRESLHQVYPYGTEILVLSDGELYCDIFGISQETTKQYMERLIHYRNKLNLHGGISIICLKELINRSSENSKAWEIAKYIRKQLVKELENKNSEVYEFFSKLKSGMKWNANSRNYFEKIPDDVCLKILRGNVNDISDEYKTEWIKFDMKAENAALEYASINLMLRWTNVISKFFPDAIRATVHPKKGQFATTNSSGAYAWNGVAWSKDWPSNADDIRIVPFISLCEYSDIKQVNFEHSGLPCFFTCSFPHMNINAAKLVLHSKGWNFEDIYGREFISSDIDDFIALGRSDQYFSWERKIQTDNYFSGLFQFRVSHYEKYGFGIHGLWIGNRLIGQFGLQVLDEKKDQIELVLFLGESYTKHGIGTKLTDYIIHKCAVAGMDALYGVVRPDNPEAIALMRKFNGIQIRTIKHFNQDGIVHKINLRG